MGREQHHRATHSLPPSFSNRWGLTMQICRAKARHLPSNFMLNTSFGLPAAMYDSWHARLANVSQRSPSGSLPAPSRFSRIEMRRATDKEQASSYQFQIAPPSRDFRSWAQLNGDCNKTRKPVGSEKPGRSTSIRSTSTFEAVLHRCFWRVLFTIRQVLH
jgi:hypothetical protein